MPEAISKLYATILESTKTYKWWWAGGGGGVLVAVAALVVIYGGFFGPSGKLICGAALTQARDFGVIPYSAVLANSEAKSTDVKGRRVCTAQVGDDTYNVQADVKLDDKACRKDMTQPDCVKLYSVARSDGMTTYQVREVPPDEPETAALPPPDAAAPAGDAQPATGASDAGSGADTAVDNSAAPPGGLDSAPSAPPAQPAQDTGQPNPQ